MLLGHAAFREKSLLSPVFIWEHAAFLLCALGGGGALVAGCSRKGRFQEDADSGLICGTIRLSSGSGLWILLSVPWEESVSLWRLKSLVFGGKRLLLV